MVGSSIWILHSCVHKHATCNYSLYIEVTNNKPIVQLNENLGLYSLDLPDEAHSSIQSSVDPESISRCPNGEGEPLWWNANSNFGRYLSSRPHFRVRCYSGCQTTVISTSSLPVQSNRASSQDRVQGPQTESTTPCGAHIIVVESPAESSGTIRNCPCKIYFPSASGCVIPTKLCSSGLAPQIDAQ